MPFQRYTNHKGMKLACEVPSRAMHSADWKSAMQQKVVLTSAKRSIQIISPQTGSICKTREKHTSE